MTELREFLDAQLAEHLPTGQPDFARVERRVTARRRHRRGIFVVVATAAVATVGALALLWPDSGTGTDPSKEVAIPTASSSAAPDDERQGEVAADGAFSCVEQYSPAAVGTRGFAFDGTITAIDEGSQQTGTSLAGAESWEVTFEVNEWFSGADTPSVVVSMFRPMPASDDRPAAYGEGTRLLVSGEDLAGDASYLAWSCGFTRYYDADTANQWRAATT